MEARVATALGCVAIDLESDDAFLVDDDPPMADTGRGLSAARRRRRRKSGSRIVAAVDRRPPLMISDDVGLTWREAGGGLPVGTAIAIDRTIPTGCCSPRKRASTSRRTAGASGAASSSELIGITAVAFS